MAFGPHCEFKTLTECARKYRGKVFDEWAYCQEIRNRTEIRHCAGLSSQLHLPEPTVSSPGGALSDRHEWETRISALADEAVADFLVRVEAQAREALSSAVVLAAANPFSLAGIRALWRRLTRRHPILEVLPEEEMADTAYAEAAEILTTAADSRTVSDRLTTALSYESPDSVWQERTARAARTYATRAYNEAAIDRLHEEGYTSKQWVSRRDERTRHSHRRADGQTVPLHDSFEVGGSLLAYPGDVTGPPSETYNCRCVVIGKA